jgi:hypothetical protein
VRGCVLISVFFPVILEAASIGEAKPAQNKTGQGNGLKIEKKARGSIAGDYE